MTARNPKEPSGRGGPAGEAAPGGHVPPSGVAFVGHTPDGPHRLEYMAVRCRTALLNQEPGQDCWDQQLRAAADEIERLRVMEADTVPRIAQLMRAQAALVNAANAAVDLLAALNERDPCALDCGPEREALIAALELARGERAERRFCGERYRDATDGDYFNCALAPGHEGDHE